MGDRGNQREPNGVTMTERPPFSQADKEEDTRKTWTFIWSHHDETASFSTQTKSKSHHNRTTSFLLAKPKGGTQLGVKE
jgi:hypothetical protein